jgi:hypothetical protein
MDFQHGATLLSVYVKHVEANPCADILHLKEKIGHVRLSLLHFEGQTEAQHVAIDLACATVVDFLMHRDEDCRLQDVMQAIERLKSQRREAGYADPRDSMSASEGNLDAALIAWAGLGVLAQSPKGLLLP